MSRPALSWLRGRRPPVQRAAEQPAPDSLDRDGHAYTGRSLRAMELAPNRRALAGANMLGSAGVGLLALYGGVVLGRAL